MAFAYRAEQIIQIVKWRKVPRLSGFLKPGEPIPFQNYGDRGRRIDLFLDLVDGPLVDLKFHVRAPVLDNPETYEAALLLSGKRVRGIGWNPTSRWRFYKRRIPAGWHENLMDPNREPKDPDFNRHLGLPNLQIVDLTDFFMKTAAHWNIELKLEKELF